MLGPEECIPCTHIRSEPAERERRLRARGDAQLALKRQSPTLRNRFTRFLCNSLPDNARQGLLGAPRQHAPDAREPRGRLVSERELPGERGWVGVR